MQAQSRLHKTVNLSGYPRFGRREEKARPPPRKSKKKKKEETATESREFVALEAMHTCKRTITHTIPDLHGKKK